MLLFNFSKKQNIEQGESVPLSLPSPLGTAEEPIGLFNTSEPKPTADYLCVPLPFFMKFGTACCINHWLLYLQEQLFQFLVQVCLEGKSYANTLLCCFCFLCDDQIGLTSTGRPTPSSIIHASSYLVAAGKLGLASQLSTSACSVLHSIRSKR